MQPMIRTTPFVFATLGALALSGVRPATLQAQSRSERDAFTWSGKIDEGRWINIRNLNGSIDVQPGTGDKVEVTANRYTRRGDPEYVRFEVKKYGPRDADVLICALWGDNTYCDEDSYRSRNSSNRNRNEVTVEFRVRVPKGVKVAAHTVNGECRVEDVGSEVDAGTVNGSVIVSTSGGPVNASTVNGSVRASMGRFDPNADMTFSTVNGSVVAEFPNTELNADVDLSTVNGRFYMDFPVTISGRIDPRRLRASIGKGGPRIRLSTVNGNVELRKR